MAKVEEAWRTGPAGIMIFHPNGANAFMPRQLATQFGTDVAAMLLAALLLSQMTAAGYMARVFLVTVMALFPSLQSEVPEWNWYGFPAVYVLSHLLVHLVGFFAGGLVIAKLVTPAKAPGSAEASAAIAA
jgi:hypothetical protein